MAGAAAEGLSVQATEAPRTIEKIIAPFEMPPLVRPQFSNRVFDIRDFGAVGNGVALNSTAIAKAISACADAGGGRVLVPDGTWLTGTVHLQSNVELHLAAGAVLRFSTDPQDYLPGPGPQGGPSRATHLRYPRGRSPTPADQSHRLPQRSTRGFHHRRARAFWTIQCIDCRNVLVRDLDVRTFDGPNTDGVNLDSSQNVLVEYCRFDTGDDCVCLKSGINEDGWRVNRPTENIVVRNISSRRGHGGVVIGSETSGGVAVHGPWL